jgi:hypothetical protein
MKVHRVLPVLFAAALVAASCGGDDDDGAAPTDAAGSEPGTTGTTGAPA